MKTMVSRFASACALVVVVYACTPAPSPTPVATAPTDFIAGDSNLVNVASTWNRVAGPYVGAAAPDGSFLGQAHRATDTTVVRTIYARNNFVTITKDASGRYPVGTMVVKLFRRRSDSTVVGGSMMVKRGGDFASANRSGWEWINLNASGAITTRFRNDSAATGCINCHTARMANDYSFSLK